MKTKQNHTFCAVWMRMVLSRPLPARTGPVDFVHKTTLKPNHQIMLLFLGQRSQVSKTVPGTKSLRHTDDVSCVTHNKL